MSKAGKILVVVIGFLVMVFCYYYMEYRIIKVDGRNAAALENSIMAAVKTGDMVDMREMAPFQWDELYYFHAYTPPEQMYGETGARWTNNNTFMGYLMFNDYEKELLHDGYYALIFLREGKAVCHYTGASDKFDFDPKPGGIKAEDSVFRVEYIEAGQGKKYPLLRKL